MKKQVRTWKQKTFWGPLSQAASALLSHLMLRLTKGEMCLGNLSPVELMGGCRSLSHETLLTQLFAIQL